VLDHLEPARQSVVQVTSNVRLGFPRMLPE
jgi:hypothetical protein